MKKLFYPCVLLPVFLLVSIFPVVAQNLTPKPKHEFWHRVSVGGNVGLQLGSITAIDVSPEVMVRVVDQFHLGLGFSYDYLRYKNYFWDDTTQQYLDFKSNVYGGRIFARYYLRSFLDNFLGNIFVHVEYEYLYYTRPYVSDANGRITDPYGYKYSKGKEVLEVNSLFVGAGYEQPLGDRAFLDILVLYNFNETYNSPYTNPVFRLGFGFRL